MHYEKRREASKCTNGSKDPIVNLTTKLLGINCRISFDSNPQGSRGWGVSKKREREGLTSQYPLPVEINHKMPPTDTPLRYRPFLEYWRGPRFLYPRRLFPPPVRDGPNEPPRSNGEESKNQSWSVANGLVFAEASGLITIAKIMVDNF